MSEPTTAADLREHIVANLFDGDDGGTLTIKIATLADDIVLIVQDWLIDNPLVAAERKRIIAALDKLTVFEFWDHRAAVRAIIEGEPT